MVSQEKLQKYAKLAVRTGVNVQKGQLMVITASVDCGEFARLCMEEGYRAGAGQVQIEWGDEQAGRLRYEYETTESLARVPSWRVEQRRDGIQQKCCYLDIESSTPGLLGHISGEKLQAANLARQTAFEPFQYYTLANHGQWSIVAIPTPAWAKKVFPQETAEKALELLWDAVLMSVRIGEDNDAVADWDRHNEALSQNCRRLNALRFDELHFRNSVGTDLRVKLVQNHVWAGGGAVAKNGACFSPNMPTEEVFTMPHKCGVNGRVVATKPLNYQGKTIENFWFQFQNGKVADFGAQKGADVLKNLLECDAGSSYLGEVALIPFHSPIADSGVLFLSTLFDENASCHLALGTSYPENLQGGEDMTRETLEKLGSNYSKEHRDFMFGSADLRVEGTTQDGTSVLVFEDGDFAAATGFVQG